MTARSFAVLALAGLPLIAPGLLSAQEETASVDGASCFAIPEPVVTLDYGSRYTAESEDRSDLDEEANAEVEVALGPVDDFITDLAEFAGAAGEGGEEAGAAADCVVDAVHAWAEADALSRLQTMNAQISSPSRLAGIALAYRQVEAVASGLDEERRAVIEGWLEARVRASMAYFDDEAPPMSSRNNLRAWAGLAAAAVGQTTGNAEIADWAARTVELVACQADEDGALPLEMERGPRALHYQLHATAALVVSATLLSDNDRDLFEVCDGALHRIVGFVPSAFENERLAAGKAGEAQTYFEGDEELRGFELAWAEAYLARFDLPALEDFVAPFRPLANSKLGGDQTDLWSS